MGSAYLERIDEAVSIIRGVCCFSPSVGIVLGSGLGSFADRVSGSVAIPYSDIPGFPRTSVHGHAGRFVVGRMHGQDVAVVDGRFHPYEGHDMRTVALPVRVLQRMGVRTLILTNSAGGLVPSLQPGDLMVITDHINLMFDNPLIGPNDEELGPRFVATRGCYTQELVDMAFSVASRKGLPLREGVYVATTGPVYETPATANFFRMIGGHAVGMSTVPEAIVAAHAGMDLLALSMITDGAGRRNGKRLTHEEVLEVASRYGVTMAGLLDGLVEELGARAVES